MLGDAVWCAIIEWTRVAPSLLGSLTAGERATVSKQAKLERLLVQKPVLTPEQFNEQMKAIMRSGAPTNLRADAWRSCIDRHVGTVRARRGDGYYTNLLKRRMTLDHEAEKQIRLDLLRTFPENIHYRDRDSDGIARLERVLTAYSRHNQQIGYTQGMNRLAAVALIVLDEEDAFWLLIAITEYLLPGKFCWDRVLFTLSSLKRACAYLSCQLSLPILYTNL